MRSTTRGVVRPIRRESAKCIPSPWAALIVVSFVAGCATLRPLPLTASTSPPAAASANELPFDPSPEDRPSAGITGFVDTVKVALADGTEAIGPRIQGVQPGSGLDAAGVKKDDVIVGVGGTILRPGDPDPTARCRDLILTHPPDTTTRFLVWNEGSGLRTVTVRLGRRPPLFARIATPSAWFESAHSNTALDDTICGALALDGGAARAAETLERNRKHAAERDVFRLRQVTEAHMNLTANEPLAIEVATAISGDPLQALHLAAGAWKEAASHPEPVLAAGTNVVALVESIAPPIVEIDRLARSALEAWTPQDGAYFAENFHTLTERLSQGKSLGGDNDPARERTNRRLVALLAKVDVARLADAALRARRLVAAAVPRLTAAARAAKTDGLLASKDTPAGRIEVWGGGSQKHTNRCAFLFDLAGNDNYLDVAGRADQGQPVSIYVDDSGEDLWAATSPFGLASAFGGVAIVLDAAGDDQYLSRDWTQGAAVAGFALLEDAAGRDVYHAQHLSQGIGLVGAGVVVDGGEDDLYTGSRFCQGVGLPGGVGAVIDREGSDRYVCTGRYDSDYGDIGQFSGWGQGVGYGFRRIASGGIGLLFDARGDDVYEAGNFSQGGGYFYGWGVLWDAQGKDRYIGSRYAQGFAAHQAVGTFLESRGDDLYQSHSGVAQGLAWDESSVVFHDRGGNDRYETQGFSLASAAHNAMALFLEDGGDDVYAGMPANAGANDYHGGKSLALFLDRGGKDVYPDADARRWNNRAAVRDEGAYFLDLPPRPAPLRTYLK